MYLEEIAIYGFKTFRNETRLKLSPRITAIVGPNGSGKSNIVDAVRWALGEHRLTLLRAATATDLIFSGSSFKKPLSVASVKLIFNNEDRAFPSVNTPRVIIERRIYRSKDSHYFLNGEEIRLQDIFSIFYSAGMYNQTYSIVGQGRIDEILLAKPEQKRALIEQVAGVSVFKKKRKDALKKLDETEQNLLRVKDLLNELQKKTERIINESKKAHMYYFLKDRLKQLEGTLLNYSLTNLKREIETLESGLKDFDAELYSVSEKIRKLRSEIDKEAKENESFLKSIEELKEKENELKIRLATFEEKERSDSDRKEALEKMLAELESSLESIERKIKFLEKDKEEILKKKDAAKESAEKKKEEISMLKKEIARLNEKIKPLLEMEKEAEKRKEVLRNALTDKEKRIGVLEVAINNLETEKRRITFLVESAKKAQFENPESIKNKMEKIKLFLEEKEHALSEEKEKVALLKYRISETKKFIEAFSGGKKNYPVGTLGSLLKNTDILPGIEEELSSVIIENESGLSGKKKGSFFVKNRLKKFLIKESGSVKPLDREGGFLQGIYVAEDIASAFAFFAENAEKLFVKKIITKDGFVLKSPFEIKVNSSILAKEREKLLALLEREARERNRSINSLYNEIRENKKRISELSDAYLKALREEERRKEALEKEKRIPLIAKEIEEKKEEISVLKSDAEKIRTKISAEGKRTEINEIQKKLNNLKNILNGKLFSLKDSEFELRRLSDAEESISSRIKGLLRKKEEIKKQVSETETDLKIVKQALFSIEKEQNKIKLDLAEIARKKKELQGREYEITNEFRRKNLELERLTEQKEEIARKIEKQKIALAEKRAKVEATKEKMKEKVIREYEISYRVDQTKLRAEIASVKSKMESLGAIDFTSVEEEESVKEELNKKKAVYDDVLESKKELERFIKEMEENAKRAFENTLSGVEKYFAEFFRKMFRGGEAFIERITDERGEIKGIELDVRLPGKKRQSLPLLSGGEKSLTALAFLFAIFKVKPAPFYVLDEVDAALDEENVVRFGELLSEEADFAQFIVITHNKETMQRADMLYGITMEEDGVSKTVSLKFV